jgi:hypothetical protein
MMILESLRAFSVLGLLGLVVSVGTVGLALMYAIKPKESVLILVRPMSLAAIFGGLTSFTVGITTVMIGISNSGFTEQMWRGAAVGAAESLVALLVAFGCLTIAWLLVALGIRRGDRSLASDAPSLDVHP